MKMLLTRAFVWMSVLCACAYICVNECLCVRACMRVHVCERERRFYYLFHSSSVCLIANFVESSVTLQICFQLKRFKLEEFYVSVNNWTKANIKSITSEVFSFFLRHIFGVQKCLRATCTKFIVWSDRILQCAEVSVTPIDTVSVDKRTKWRHN